MIEVLWHGRGGQGAFTAARLLGAAASVSGEASALAFPSFGPERRGAPIRAFTKIACGPVGDRSAIERAEVVVYLDETLFQAGYDAELKDSGRVLVNSGRTFDDVRIAAIDADRISTEVLGRPLPNTALLGALTALMEGLALDDVNEAIKLYMPEKLARANVRVAALGAEACRAALEKTGCAGETPARSRADAHDDSDSRLARLLARAERAERPPARIPAITRAALDPADYARTTCFSAGNLVESNAGWRNVRPVVDPDACTGCLECYLYCPDGAIFKVPPQNAGKRAAVALDYDFCKGCGMCVRACRFDALALVPESRARAVCAHAASRKGEGVR